VWTEADARAAPPLRRGRPPHVDRRISDFLKREAQRDINAASHGYAARSVSHQAHLRPRPVQPLGLVLEHGVLSFSVRLFSRRRSCSTIWPRTRSPISSSSTLTRFWRLVKRLYPQVERAKGWPRRETSPIARYGLPHRRSTKDI